MLDLPEGGRVTLRVFLPDTFPTDPPSMNLVEVSPLGALVHPWLDHSQHVVGCEALRAWSVKKSSLVVVGACGRCCAFAVPSPARESRLVSVESVYFLPGNGW